MSIFSRYRILKRARGYRAQFFVCKLHIIPVMFWMDCEYISPDNNVYKIYDSIEDARLALRDRMRRDLAENERKQQDRARWRVVERF